MDKQHGGLKELVDREVQYEVAAAGRRRSMAPSWM